MAEIEIDMGKQGAKQERLRRNLTDTGGWPETFPDNVRSAKTPLTSTKVLVWEGGGGGNRTRVQGFAGPCLNHSATPPGEGATVDDPSSTSDSPAHSHQPPYWGE